MSHAWVRRTRLLLALQQCTAVYLDEHAGWRAVARLVPICMRHKKHLCSGCVPVALSIYEGS